MKIGRGPKPRRHGEAILALHWRGHSGTALVKQRNTSQCLNLLDTLFYR
jgi:hypothetical protein